MNHSELPYGKFAGGVFALLQRIFPTYECQKGGILIEFAFSIPVCISLLLFVNDHFRFYELKSKLKTSAYLAASMLQQIKNTKTDKQLTKFDLANVSYSSCLNFFHTNSMFSPFPFGIYYALDCHYVKRINSNCYKYQLCYATTSTGNSPESTNFNCGSVDTKTMAQIEAINSDLVCNADGDERVLVATHYRKSSYNKKKLGFFILEPHAIVSAGDSTNNLFIHELVIIPKPGIFPARNTR